MAPPSECPTCERSQPVDTPLDQTNRRKLGLTATTDVAPLVLIKFLTSVKMLVAVALCASLNPLWTMTSPVTPGKRVELSGTWLILKSVRSDKLCIQRLGQPTLKSSVSLIKTKLTIGLDLSLGVRRSRIFVAANTQQRLGSRE